MSEAEIWRSECGRVVLYCGDCLKVLPELSGVDAVVTDPPYGVGLGTKANNQRTISKNRQYSSYEDSKSNLESLVEKFMPCVMRASKRAAITPGVANMWIYPRPHHTGSYFYPSASGCNPWGFSCWQPILFYGKDPYLAARRGSRPDSMQSTEKAEKNGHPCPKPIGQWKWLVERASIESETVLDPFMGSGTTGVACIKTGRKFIGIELDPGYFAIAKKRIQDELARYPLLQEAVA